MKELHKWKYDEMLILFGLIVTPIAIVWKIMNFEEPQGIYETLQVVIITIVTICGGLGIGLMLGKKYSDILNEEVIEK